MPLLHSAFIDAWVAAQVVDDALPLDSGMPLAQASGTGARGLLGAKARRMV